MDIKVETMPSIQRFANIDELMLKRLENQWGMYQDFELEMKQKRKKQLYKDEFRPRPRSVVV